MPESSELPPQPLYHYAESEPSLYDGDFSTTTVDDGYLPVDVEYERPNRNTIVQSPMPPRRMSIAAVDEDATESYPKVEARVTSPTLPPPRLFPKVQQPEPHRPRPWRTYVGLIGCLGLAGLSGMAVGGSRSSSSSPSSDKGAACVVGTVQWSASAMPIPGHVVADGSEIDVLRYPEYGTAVGDRVPNLIDRYARGGTIPGTALEASVDAASLSVEVSDPGHSHIDSTGFAVVRDGQYSLAHLYTFTTAGMNLKDAGPPIVGATTGITASLRGGSETRPASVVLVPHICIGKES